MKVVLDYGKAIRIIFFWKLHLIIDSLHIVYFLFLFSSFSKIFSYEPKDSYFERAWWASIFYFSLSQLTDIQYYDGKISLIAWILLAGLKNIIYESETNSVNNKENN